MAPISTGTLNSDNCVGKIVANVFQILLSNTGVRLGFWSLWGNRKHWIPSALPACTIPRACLKFSYFCSKCLTWGASTWLSKCSEKLGPEVWCTRMWVKVVNSTVWGRPCHFWDGRVATKVEITAEVFTNSVTIWPLQKWKIQPQAVGFTSLTHRLMRQVRASPFQVSNLAPFLKGFAFLAGLRHEHARFSFRSTPPYENKNQTLFFEKSARWFKLITVFLKNSYFSLPSRGLRGFWHCWNPGQTNSFFSLQIFKYSL